MENIYEKKGQRLSCNELLSDPFANGIVRIHTRRQYRKERSEIYSERYRQYNAKRRVEGKKLGSNQNRKTYRIKGFTHEMYLALYEKQSGLCAICQKPEKVKAGNGKIRSLAVDHNHETGEVRGLLCFRCNTQLHVLENKNIKNAAQDYLSLQSDELLGS